MLKRTWTAVLLAVLMVAAALPAVAADSSTDPDTETSYELTQFNDTAGNTFENAINWLVDQGITVGCNPPTYTNFCPNEPVTRGQMAVFITRALSLPAPSDDYFDDDNGAFYESSANRLFEAGISVGCNPPDNDNFCGGDAVTRAQMATFLTRGFGLTATNVDYFIDDNGSVHETSINRVRSANVTVGCNPPVSDHFCPGDTVTRGQMSAFIKRAVEWQTNPQAPPPPPSPGPTPGPTPGPSDPCADNNVIPNSECLALMSLYNSTNGANWIVKTGWGSGNPCDWEGVECAGGRVVELKLRGNNLSGPLPNLTALSHVRVLGLGNNFLTGPVPTWFSSLNSLTHLQMDRTQFTGNIPSNLGTLPALIELDLSHTLGIDGQIPSQLGDIGTLQDLDLSGTSIDGPVPDAIGDLTNLLDLDLQATNLSGTLPNEIGLLTALLEINVSETNIDELPDELWGMASLQILELSDMPSLNMPFPADFGQLVNLVEVRMANSGFTGTIPAGIGAIGVSLVELDLSGNAMGGPIPTQITALSGLLPPDSLDLSGQLAPGGCFTFPDLATQTFVTNRDDPPTPVC